MAVYKKCPNCNYDKGHDMINGEVKERNPDDEEFVLIEGNFTTEVGSGYHKRTKKIDLYGCPKCGNVIFKTK